jgi:hypothetical protein
MTNGRARARLTAGGTSLVSLVSLASLTAFARTAGATPSARLVYSRAQSASSCPDEPALRKAVAARIGYDPFFGWAKKTVVVRMVPADGPGYVASVDLVDDEGYEHGARQIRTEGKCAELRDPVALAIAIALDPSILARGAVPPREEGEAEPTAAATTAPVPPVPRATPPATPAVPVPKPPPAQGASIERSAEPKPDPRWEPEVAAALVGSIGVAPAPAAGLSLGLGVRHGRWSAALEGRADFAASEAAPEGERVSSSLVVGTFAPCWITGLLHMCVLAQAGEFTASSSTSSSHTNPWLAFGGRFAVTVPFDALTSIRLRSDVLWDVDPPQLFLGGVPWAIWSAPSVAASFAIEGTVRF